MNTRNFFYSILAFVVLVAAVACTQNTSDDSIYEQGVDKTKLINGDSKSVDKTKIRNGDRKSVDKTKLVNGDSM